MTRAGFVVKGCCINFDSAMRNHTIWVDNDLKYDSDPYLYVKVYESPICEHLDALIKIDFCPYCGDKKEIKINDNKGLVPI